jgi:hypothetical protein
MKKSNNTDPETLEKRRAYYLANRERILARKVDPEVRAKRLEAERLHRLNNKEYYAEKRKAKNQRRKESMVGNIDKFAHYQHEILRKICSTPGRTERGIGVEITLDELTQWLKDNPVCVASGRNVVYEMNSIDKASVDRIDNTRGYTLDNIQMVTKWVNHGRMDLPYQDYIDLCVDIALKSGKVVRKV